MGTVSVDGVVHTVYNTDAAAVENYLKANAGAGRDAFLALTEDDDRARMIVAARRLIDRQAYDGTKTGGAAQALAFPRTGLTDIDGVDVDSATVPQQVKDAEAELAGLLAADPSLTNSAGTGSNIASLTAGPVSVTYHQPTLSVEAGATKLPPAIMDLLGPFFRGSAADGAPTAYGFDDCTDAEFDECAQWTRRGPFV
jgi:hypothetical protein